MDGTQPAAMNTLYAVARTVLLDPSHRAARRPELIGKSCVALTQELLSLVGR
jgi:hypothetical protein